MPPAPRPGVSAVTLPRATLAPPTSVVPTAAARPVWPPAARDQCADYPSQPWWSPAAWQPPTRCGLAILDHFSAGFPKDEQIEDQIDETAKSICRSWVRFARPG
jgi:hypothetical protein